MRIPFKYNLFSVGLFAAASITASALMAAAAFAEGIVPSFPGATGFGTETHGGIRPVSSGEKTQIFRVTSLADSGPDTLRECVESQGPRVCLFETSGRITLSQKLEISSPFITIAGQSAPSPGIMIAGTGLKISTHDVIIRDVAIRPGDALDGPKPQSRDAITVNGKGTDASRIVLDHLSLTWALDENTGTNGSGVHHLTISNCILSEGLYHSIHPDGPHSMGLLVGEGTQRLSVHDSLLANNNDRNPRQKAGSSLEFMNNAVYGWGGMGGAHGANPSDTANTGDETLLNFAGNIYIPGPDSPRRAPVYSKPRSEKLRVYVSRNIGPTREKDEGDDWTITAIPERPYRSTEPAFPLSGVSIRNPEQTLDYVLKNAGSRPFERDAVDSRIVSEVRDRKGYIKDCVANCAKNAGGWPDYAVHHRAIVLPKNAEKDTDRNGYTQLEDWLNCQAEIVETGRKADCR